MATNMNRRARGLILNAKGEVDRAQENIWVDRLTRLGYFARGVIYGLIGVLAFELVFTGRGKITGPQGALATIAQYPLGKAILIVVAIGLVGMLIWGFIRAVGDPYHKGNDFKGIATRIGYLISGLAYGSLLIPTMNLIQGSGRSSGGSSQTAQNAAAGILQKSWGPALIGAIGIVLIGVGLYRIYEAWKVKLHEQLKSYEMTAAERRWAIRLGRIGYVGVGIVFILVGILAFLAATTLNPNKIGGIDRALTFLLTQPYGPFLVGVVAVGLIAYAIYSFMGSIWFRIKGL